MFPPSIGIKAPVIHDDASEASRTANPWMSVGCPSLEKRIAADPAIEQRWLSGIPRGRLGQPTDIQGLAVLLASDASSWITGALIPMDGGNMAMNAGATIGK